MSNSFQNVYKRCLHPKKHPLGCGFKHTEHQWDTTLPSQLPESLNEAVFLSNGCQYYENVFQIALFPQQAT